MWVHAYLNIRQNNHISIKKLLVLLNLLKENHNISLNCNNDLIKKKKNFNKGIWLTMEKKTGLKGLFLIICLKKVVMLTIVKFSIVDRLSTIKNISIPIFDINIELGPIVS